MFVVFDLDGTMADIDHRLHVVQGEKQNWDLFFELCHEDEPIPEIIAVCQAMHRMGHYIEIWSGRKERCRAKTEAWLEAHGVPYYELQLRPDGDERPDTELKEEWLLKQRRIPMGVEPDLVFDDRRRLVDMWRRNGIRCCHVAEGDY